MAADMSIHVLTDKVNEETVRILRGPLWSETRVQWHEAYESISMTPQVYVGEVSWLKAAVFEDQDTFIPDPVGAVSDIIDRDFPTIDEALIQRIEAAMGLKNTTGYTIGSGNKVVEFLRQHIGKKAFTISW